MFFFGVSTRFSILYCQYDLGFDPFLVGNGFQYFLFYFRLTLLSLLASCELYIYIFLMIL